MGQSVSGSLLARTRLSGMRQCLVLLLVVGSSLGMELGRSGVYDSPMAQDYYVRRFGFMFGGGRSGMYGLEALQQVEDPMHLHSRHSSPSHHHHQHHHHQAKQEKAMVELSPIVMKSNFDRQPKQFPRFMAVP